MEWKSHGEWAIQIKSWKLNIFWTSHGISLLVANDAREVLMIWLRGGFGLCSEFNIVMLGRGQPYFRLLIFSLKIDLTFRICHEYAIFCVCLPGIMENYVTCHGKVMEFYYQISVGTLLLLKKPHLIYLGQSMFVIIGGHCEFHCL